MLWLQPLAMVLGIIMLSAIAYVATSTGERPFNAINRHVNPVLGWGWALASLAANMVWCLPQYSLATGVLQQNLMPEVLGPSGPLGDFGAKLLIVTVVLAITLTITWTYESGSWGIKVYEGILKLMVALIVLCFFGVLMALRNSIQWSEILWGFIPDFTSLYEPAKGFNEVLAATPAEYRGFWENLIISEQRNVMISAAATAVGINMTFLFPYSMLAKGWTKEFRGLAIFDLATGMFIPFVLATSCVVIAAATQFHPRPGAVTLEAGESVPPARKAELEAQRLKFVSKLSDAELKKLTPEEISQRVAPLSEAEQKLAVQLVRRDAFDLAGALAPLTGREVANWVFGLGVLGMTLSTITLLMLISGFVVCEMLGLPPKGWPHRLGCLAAVTGVLGPFVWSGEALFWLAVPTSVFGMMLLPIAYLSFFLLMNQKSLLGKEMPRGGKRFSWNLLMGIATAVATFASFVSILVSPFGPRGPYPYGLYVYAALILLAVVVHFLRKPNPVATEPATD
jgi:hypothetical protein